VVVATHSREWQVGQVVDVTLIIKNAAKVKEKDLVNLILNGSIIEDYPDTKPCPSALMSREVAAWNYRVCD
jgi:hypothetical protein